MRWLAALAGLGAFAPAVVRADEDIDIPGLDATDLRGDALIWEDANIYLEPWETGASFRFNMISRRRDEPGRVMAVRIVDSTLRNFVEIEAPGRADCSFRKLDIDNRIEGLRMFVRREDLAPVLVKPYQMQWSDGTRIKLAVGMPVSGTTTGDYVVPLRDDKVRLSIPHASVGYIYKAGKVADPELPKEKVARLDRGINVKLGDDGFTVRTTNWLGPMPDKKTESSLFKLAARCFEMTVEAPSISLRPTEVPRPYPATPQPPPPITGWRIRAGTPLMTASNREVAVAAKDIPVQMPAPAPETVCFDARISMLRDDQTWGQVPRTFKLCAAGGSVEK